MRMSHPPTNSPFTYTCGIVGHSLEANSQTIANAKSKFINSRKLLDTAPKLSILQYVVGLQLLRRYTLDLEHLYRGTRETTLRRVGRAFHEENDWCRRNGLLDLAPGLIRDKPPCYRKGAGGEGRCNTERGELACMSHFRRPAH